MLMKELLLLVFSHSNLMYLQRFYCQVLLLVFTISLVISAIKLVTDGLQGICVFSNPVSQSWGFIIAGE
jgi:uncharacterized membrane protein